MQSNDEDVWERADEILDRLLDLPEEARAAALQAMQLSPGLTECVERLLQAQRSPGALDRWPAGIKNESAATLVGRRIGRWILQRELGRGGMAIVWQACHEGHENEHLAAIKLYPVGAMARPELSRIRREQAILARLNHPHIAHLYEAGETDDGTPYLAMELVDGERIDTWCDRFGEDVRARVRLMLRICAAMAYAHRNLVVHADLKPSNVLVDQEGLVRVLDFGIGRLLDERFAEMTVTLARAVTPEYAAPEQMAGDPASTAADVYGLGALLYRLLTGVGPQRRGSSGDVQMPSRLAAARMQEHELPRGVRVADMRGDLDTIVLKALCHEPDQRYTSVDAMHADLSAWLDLRPITARGPGRRYRMHRFILRNRLAVAAGIALALALMVGLATTVWQARRAEHEATAAVMQTQRAVAVKNVLVRLLQRTDPGRVAGDPPASQLLREGAQEVHDNTGLAPSIRAELLRVIGTSQSARGQYRDARDTLDAALQLYENGDVRDRDGWADALRQRALVANSMDDLEGAISLMRQADHVLDQGDGGMTRSRERVRAGLADMLAIGGHPAEATRMASDLLARLQKQARTHGHFYSYVLRILGMAADIDHRPLDALHWQQQAAQALDPVRDAPNLANVHNEMGLALWHANEWAQAESQFRLAVDGYIGTYGPDNPRTLTVRRHLAAVRLMRGQVGEAVAELTALRKAIVPVYGSGPGRDMARTDYWLAMAHYLQGHTRLALKEARRAWGMASQLSPSFRASHDTMAPLVGLLDYDLRGRDGEAMLDKGGQACGSRWPPVALRRWICIARSSRLPVQEKCRALQAVEPPSVPAFDGVDRRWWALYHLQRADCVGNPDRQSEWRAARKLAINASPAFPPWLRDRLLAGPVRR